MTRMLVLVVASLAVALVPSATAGGPIGGLPDFACQALEPLYGGSCRVVAQVEGIVRNTNACDPNNPSLEPLYGSLEPLYGSTPYQVACRVVASLP